MATATKRTHKATIGGLIDSMHDVREKRRALAAEDKILGEEYEQLEKDLIALLDSEDTDKGAGRKASATIGEEEAFNFDGDNGFDLFMAYVAKTKYFHLVQRRISAPSVRELFASKGKVPGLVPYIKRRVNLRNL
jgi:hypothetical protein